MSHWIICGSCSSKHNTKQQVWDCHQRKATPPAANMRAMVPSQPSVGYTTWPFKTPEAMVRGIADGWYAVAPSGNDAVTTDHVFIRVSHPKTRQQRGNMVIQTQHSESYKPLITFYPTGSLRWWQRGDNLDQALMLVAADPFTTSQRYAAIHKRCGRCNLKLTDKRSRWYGIGPECEKHWPWVIDEVNDTKGVFVPTY